MSKNCSFRDELKKQSHKWSPMTCCLTHSKHRQCCNIRQVIYGIAKKPALGNIRENCHSQLGLKRLLACTVNGLFKVKIS